LMREVANKSFSRKPATSGEQLGNPKKKRRTEVNKKQGAACQIRFIGGKSMLSFGVGET